MKRDRHEILPQSRFAFEFREPRFRWRTTAAALRREKLNQMCSGRSAFEYQIARVGGRRDRQHEQNEARSH
jgi:hypothetical protein